MVKEVQLGKLAQQRKRRRIERNQAATVVDKDEARQGMPAIVAYYEDLPLPAGNDRYNRRLSLLRDRALVNVLYSTAARLSEVLALNRSQVGHGRAQTATIIGKGQKPRTLHSAPDALRPGSHSRLSGCTGRCPSGAVCVPQPQCQRGQTFPIWGTLVKKAVKAENLEPSLSAHDFRHYRATQLLREGMPLEVVQELLGHADVSTTRGIYAPVLGVQVVREWLDNMDQPPQQNVNGQ